jgi:hypothetical protein
MTSSNSDLDHLNDGIIQALKDGNLLSTNKTSSQPWQFAHYVICKVVTTLEAANSASEVEKRVFNQNWEYSIRIKKLLDLVHIVAEALHQHLRPVGCASIAFETRVLHDVLKLVGLMCSWTDDDQSCVLYNWLLKKQNGLMTLSSALQRRLALGLPADFGLDTDTAKALVLPLARREELQNDAQEMFYDVHTLSNCLKYISEIWTGLIWKHRLIPSWSFHLQWMKKVQETSTHEYLMNLLRFLNKVIRTFERKLIIPVVDRYSSIQSAGGQEKVDGVASKQHSSEQVVPINYTTSLLHSKDNGYVTAEHVWESLMKNFTRMLLQVQDICDIHKTSSSDIGSEAATSAHSSLQDPLLLNHYLQPQLISLSLPYLTRALQLCNCIERQGLYRVSGFILDTLASVPNIMSDSDAQEIDFITCCTMVYAIVLLTCPQAEPNIPHSAVRQLYSSLDHVEESDSIVEDAKKLILKTEMLFSVSNLVFTTATPTGEE